VKRLFFAESTDRVGRAMAAEALLRTPEALLARAREADPFRLYVGGHEVRNVDEAPANLDEADRTLLALLRGLPAGTTGRVDVFTYPHKRGAHAYRAERSYTVDADGEPRAENAS
jgi:hypothetical protein